MPLQVGTQGQRSPRRRWPTTAASPPCPPASVQGSRNPSSCWPRSRTCRAPETASRHAPPRIRLSSPSLRRAMTVAPTQPSRVLLDNVRHAEHERRVDHHLDPLIADSSEAAQPMLKKLRETFVQRGRTLLV